MTKQRGGAWETSEQASSKVMYLCEWVPFLSDKSYLSEAMPCDQVAVRVFRNKTAINVERIFEPFDPKAAKTKGPKPFLERHNIVQVTPEMIAYAAIQVSPLLQPVPASNPTFV
jgi:hypothetical protein